MLILLFGSSTAEVDLATNIDSSAVTTSNLVLNLTMIATSSGQTSKQASLVNSLALAISSNGIATINPNLTLLLRLITSSLGSSSQASNLLANYSLAILIHGQGSVISNLVETFILDSFSSGTTNQVSNLFPYRNIAVSIDGNSNYYGDMITDLKLDESSYKTYDNLGDLLLNYDLAGISYWSGNNTLDLSVDLGTIIETEVGLLILITEAAIQQVINLADTLNSYATKRKVKNLVTIQEDRINSLKDRTEQLSRRLSGL